MRQLGAVAAAYSLATTPFNIAPLLVSAVITVMGANEQQSGQLMTLELLSMSLVAMLAAPLGQRARKPWVLTLAVLLLVVVHSISALVCSYSLLLGLRIVAGIGAGTLLLAVNTTIAASSDPVRLYGACSMATATVGLLLLLVVPSLIAGLGMAGAYAPLALVALIVLGIVRWMGSTDMGDTSKEAAVAQEGSAISPMVIGLLLIALFAIQFTQGALYSFSERMGVEQAGLSPAEMGILLAVGYAANATVAGISIDNMSIIVEGDLDLHTFLGMKEGNAGYDNISVKVTLDCDASPEALAALHEKVINTSPVGHTLSRPVPVNIELA